MMLAARRLGDIAGARTLQHRKTNANYTLEDKRCASLLICMAAKLPPEKHHDKHDLGVQVTARNFFH